MNNNNKKFWADADIGVLIIRLTLGGLLILHGIHKVQTGLDDQMGLLAAKGIPTFFMYLVYISEIVAPVLIILGIFTRLSAASIVVTLLVVLYVAPFPLMAMGPHGEWAIEIQIFYLFIPLALFFMGPGRFSVRPNKSGNWLLD
ncbi:MAG: DoxX family protein [Woeseiaceae bacterium]